MGKCFKQYTKRSTDAARDNLAAFKKTMGKAVYTLMVDRCTNPKNANWKNYGGRGITICEEWLRNPDDFYLFAMTHGWKKGLQLDRRDNNKGYAPWNCRFVTAKENCRNTRANIPVEIYDSKGKLLTTANSIAEAAEITNTATNTVQDSINKVIDIASGKYRFKRTIGEILPNWVVSCLGKSVKVTDKETGKQKWFRTENEAARHYRVNHVTIRHWCLGMKVCKADNADNLKFEYISRKEWETLRPGAAIQLELDFGDSTQEEAANRRISWRRVRELVKNPFTRIFRGLTNLRQV